MRIARTPEELRAAHRESNRDYRLNNREEIAQRRLSRMTPEKREKVRRDSRRYYAENREEILKKAKATNRKEHPDTPEERVASHQRRSEAKKKAWKKMSPAAKDAFIQSSLAVGWERKIAKNAEQRSEWAWEAIKLYLKGRNRRQIIQQCPQATVKTLATVFRDVGLPLSSKGLYDRGSRFTRRDGTALQKGLGYTTAEFAAKIGERKRLPMIWLSTPKNGINPIVAAKCVALRNEVAKVLLSKDVRTLPNKLDQYNRKEVALALYPNLRAEYKMLLSTLPELRDFVTKAETGSSEDLLVGFVFEKACGSSDQQNNFRFLLRWLPELIPHIVEVQPSTWDTLPRLIAHEILGRVSYCPSTIIGFAVEPGVRACSSAEMRRIVQRYVDGALSAELQTEIQTLVASPRRTGRPRVSLVERTAFTVRSKVREKMLRFEQLINHRRGLQQEVRDNPQTCRDALLRAGFKPDEIAAARTTDLPIVAARHAISNETHLSYATVKRYDLTITTGDKKS